MRLLTNQQTKDKTEKGEGEGSEGQRGKVNKTDKAGGETTNEVPRLRGKVTRPKLCYMWTTADVLKWFKRHCSEYFQLYSQLFIMHDITGKALVRMSEGTLLRMGIRHPEHLEAIWREILKLKLKGDIQEMKEIEMSAAGRVSRVGY